MKHVAALVLVALAVHAEKRAIRPPTGPASGPYSAAVSTGKLLYVSGHVGPEPGGGFAPGDVKTQTRRCLDLVGRALKEAGLEQRNVVSTTLYLADIRTLDAADAAYREVYSAPYPARVEIESQLLIPAALSEVSAVAVVGDWRASIFLKPDAWAEPKRPISHSVLAADKLFMSTLRPVDGGGALVGATIAEQTAQVLRNQNALLAAAGMKSVDVAMSRFFLSDPGHRAGLDAALVGASTPRAVVVAAPFDTYHLVQAHTTAAKSPNDTVYLSAAAGSGKGIREQTASALKSIERQLARHGMTFADTLEAVVWLRDPRHAGAMNQVYREIVKPKPAARATVRLAATDPDVLIQIVMSAHK